MVTVWLTDASRQARRRLFTQVSAGVRIDRRARSASMLAHNNTLTHLAGTRQHEVERTRTHTKERT